jgi:hypothetical protein
MPKVVVALLALGTRMTQQQIGLFLFGQGAKVSARV